MFRRETFEAFDQALNSHTNSRYLWGLPGMAVAINRYQIDAPQPGKVYVRILNQSDEIVSLTTAVNLGANLDPKVKVRMEYIKGQLTIVNPDPTDAVIAYGNKASQTAVPPHSGTVGGGLDDFVVSERFMPGLVSVASQGGLFVTIQSFWVGDTYVPTQDFEIPSGSIPTADFETRITLITYDPDAADFDVTDGVASYDAVGDYTETDLELISIPDGHIPLAGVVLSEDTTDLRTDPTKVIDARQFLNVANPLYLESVVAGTNITVDNTDPRNPIIEGTAGGSITVTDGVTTVVDVDTINVGTNLVLTDDGGGAITFEAIGGGGASGAWQFVQKETLVSDTTTLSVPSLPQTYESLYCLLITKTSNASNQATRFRLNGDSSAIYQMQRLQANGASASGGASSNQTSFDMGASGGTSVTAWSVFEVQLDFYADSGKYKPIHTRNNFKSSDTAGMVVGDMGSYNSNSPITQIDFYHDAGDLVAGSILLIYGLSSNPSSLIPSWGNVFPINPVDLADFTWVNQGSAVATQQGDSVFLEVTNTATENLRILKKNAPATPYTVTVGVIPLPYPGSSVTEIGIGFRQNSNSLLHILRLNWSASALTISSTKHNSATAGVAHYTDITIPYLPTPIWLRIADDATNRICSYSWDGENFVDFHSVSRTDYLTADEVLFFVGGTSNTYVGAKFISWEEA